MAVGVKGLSAEACKLELREDARYGRGVYFTKDTAEGEVVLEIPSAVTLSARSGLPAQLAESLSDWEAWEAKLALALLTQQQAGSQSRWHEYIRALPSDVSSPFGSWPATELDALQLDSSSFEAEKLFSAALSRELPDRLCQADVAGALASIDQADFAWALSMVHSRCFENPNSDSSNSDFGDLMMVPLLDMFNHGGLQTGLLLSSGIQECSTNLRIAFCEHEVANPACIRIETTRRARAGEQACISYGENRPSAEFLLYYGFVPARNPFERAALFGGMQEAIAWFCKRFGIEVRTSTQEAIRAATAAAAPNVPLVLDDATARAIFGPLRVLANGAVDPRLTAAYEILVAALQQQTGRRVEEFILGTAPSPFEKVLGAFGGHSNSVSLLLALRSIELLKDPKKTGLLHDLSLLRDGEGEWAALYSYYSQDSRYEPLRSLHSEHEPGLSISEPHVLAVRLRAAEKQIFWNFIGEVFERSRVSNSRLSAALEWLQEA